jgi:hypothetical protein
MGKTRRGGRKTFQGMDTCVYLPAVRCEGQAERTPNSVSRVKRNEDAEYDIQVEGRLRQYFPQLVENGSITVNSRVCRPNFQDEDGDPAHERIQGDGGCSRVNPEHPGVDERYQNLVTPLREGNFNDLNKEERRQCVRDVIQAAIELVPDNGPWIIHGDAHLGNIMFYNHEGQRHSTLADWGRVIMIFNPRDFQGVRLGIKEHAIHHLQGLNQHSSWDQIADAMYAFYSPEAAHNRVPLYVTDAIYRGIRDASSQDQKTRCTKALRGMMVYVLVREMYGEIAGRHQLFECNTQDELRNVTNQLIGQGGGRRRKTYRRRKTNARKNKKA